ncbi:MAG: hypothetical protein KC449_21775, partial [Anaerolineales bacterium]|nr:hypothetical protein [Anaerolineales bacterium]
RQLMVMPLLALAVALVGAGWISSLLPTLHTAVSLVQKGLIVSVIYITLLLIFEREQVKKSGEMIQQLLHNRSGSS